jgi:tRNA(Ile)-lysidine synthase TilS/MesJ
MRKDEYCIKCVLPKSFPGIRFNDKGECQYCSVNSNVNEQENARALLLERLEDAVNNSKKKGQNYECIVALSGGKDSTYVLKLLTKIYGLRCLAVTIDNGFISETAFSNIRRVTDNIGVDHIFVKPAFKFMRKMYTKSIEEAVHSPSSVTRASDICNSCISLINNQMIKIALQNEVQLIAGGYLGGQVPQGSVTININLNINSEARNKQLERYVKNFGQESLRYFSTPNSLSSLSSLKNSITIINPLLALEYSEDKLIEEIRPLGWEKPLDTGKHSSNCLLNDFGILKHKEKHGFHPYAFDLSDLVRKGFEDRELAIKKLEAIPKLSDLLHVSKKLKG